METSHKVGRKHKEAKSFDAIVKDVNDGTPITLEEIQKITSSSSFSFAGKDGKQVYAPAKRMSVMGIQKVEARALAKLKAELARRGITRIADALLSK